MDFWRAIGVLNRRKWLILLSVLMTIGLAWSFTRLLGAKWVATVQFASPQTSALTNAAGAASEQTIRGEDAKQAAKEQAEVYTSILRSKEVLEAGLAQVGESSIRPDLMKDLEIVPVNPRLYNLQLADTTRERAMTLANAVADKFVEKNQALRTEQAHKVVALLEDQVRQADEKLAQARRRYDLFRSKNKIAGSLTNNMDMALLRMKQVQQQSDETASHLSESEARLRQKEAELASVPRTIIPVAPSNISQSSSGAAMLRSELNRLDAEIAGLRVHYKDVSPVLKPKIQTRNAMQSQLKELEAAERKQANTPQPNPAYAAAQQETSALRQQVKGYRAQFGEIRSLYRQTEAEVNKYKGVDSPLSALANDVAAQTEARANLMTRLNSARMAQDVAEREAPITIVAKASDKYNAPINSSSGRDIKLIIIAALGALLVMSCIVIAVDSLDRRVVTVREAELALPARVLAAIPQPSGTASYARIARATELDPQSLLAESYRFLGIHLLNSQDPPIRSIMVLSAKAEQGTTTTITNLGISLAQAGKRVVIVDANMRTSELHDVFHLENKSGFMDVLKKPDAETLQQALQPTSTPNLYAMTCGSTPDNPWALFRSKNLHLVSQYLLEFADFVLYDTPSAVIFTDALNIAPVVDAAYLCVRAAQQLTGAEQRLIDLLQEANVPVMGCVLTDVPASVFENFPHYQHYYDAAQASSRSVRDSGTIPEPRRVMPPVKPVPASAAGDPQSE